MAKRGNVVKLGIGLIIILAIVYACISYISFGNFRTALINSNFDLGKIGWIGSLGEVQKEGNANSFAVNDYNWGLYQIVAIKPGTSYTISADTRKGTSDSAARLEVIFYNDNDKTTLVSYDIYYWHQGCEWETIPPQVVSPPENADKARVYLLTAGGDGDHHFDNIIFSRNDSALPAAPFVVNINKPQ